MFKFNAIVKKDGEVYSEVFEGRNLEYVKLRAEEELSDREDGSVLVDIDWSEGQREKAILMESGLTWREAEKALKENTAFIFEDFEDFFLSDEFLSEEFKESGKAEEDFLKGVENLDIVEFEGRKLVIRFIV